MGPACSSIFVRTATKKQGGSSNNGRDSNPKFLGIKKYGGEHVIPGNIIARQRGTKWHCGANCGIGVDHTVYALISGRVHFTDAKNPHKRGKKVINVVPHEQWPEVLAAAQAKNAAKRASPGKASSTGRSFFPAETDPGRGERKSEDPVERGEHHFELPFSCLY